MLRSGGRSVGLSDTPGGDEEMQGDERSNNNKAGMPRRTDQTKQSA